MVKDLVEMMDAFEANLKEKNEELALQEPSPKRAKRDERMLEGSAQPNF